MQRFEFHPVISRWFAGKFGSPTAPQEQGWPAIRSGVHTLIAAPTGSGKTLAAFLASLDSLFREGLKGTLGDETRVLYVSPLKALSNDIHKNLEEPLAEIRDAFRESQGVEVNVRAEVRTGDTPASKRQAIAKKPPHILVTTPESFYLLLTSESGRKVLATVRTLIVDEIHALVGNRRGSHLSLTMERLSALARHPVQRIGLSATQKPIEDVAKFLVGTGGLDEKGTPRCTIVDTGHSRAMDLSIELPGSPLEAVMSNEVWALVYQRLVDLIEAHRTTLVFVNTRRLAERVSHQLAERLGKDKVTSHHGSLSAKLRLDAEHRLKRGELKALVATASLELGIDIGSVDLVCQLGTTRSIATLLQRVGRAEHKRAGLPKGRLFPLTRDELVESAAMLRSVRRGELDRIIMPQKPLDVLAQQIVAAAASEDWEETKLLELVRSAYPYREITTEEFAEVIRMLADGFSTKRGRRAALIHHDAVNHRVRGRRGSRLVALTSGGAIPDTGDYRVVVEPTQTFIGTVNEDFAVESMAGEVFQLGNASWRILGINSGQVRVEDAHGQPPGIPFWLGEGPARTNELSQSVSDLRDDVERLLMGDGAGDSDGARLDEPQKEGVEETGDKSDEPGAGGSAAGHRGAHPDTAPKLREPGLCRSAPVPGRSNVDSAGALELPNPALTKVLSAAEDGAEDGRTPGAVSKCARPSPAVRGEGDLIGWFMNETGVSEPGARQLADYFVDGYKALGVIPSREKIVLERFFDESGGMQLVIHSLFGARINRAWGLALRKRFCRSFNFELQAAATDDAIVLSLGTQHSFPLEEVFHYLRSTTVRELLVQALLDAPMFGIRWRWNATRALALPRQRGGRKVPAPLQRMESENLLAAVFPDQLACLENIVGDRKVPDHPLVKQTIDDCLVEAMDIEGLEALLRRIETGTVECFARDLPEPSPLAHEILHARPYAFLDNAPLEERRTQAVYTRRAGERSADDGLGVLDAAAIERVCQEAWPEARNADELHEALLLMGALTDQEAARCAPDAEALLRELENANRACRVEASRRFWTAAERLPMVQAVYPGARLDPPLVPPASVSERVWERSDALRELVRGRMEVIGPVTVTTLAEFFHVPTTQIDAALLALEAEGFVLRGKFQPGAKELEWCDRRLLARIHRLTLNRLRAEIQPVSLADFQRFLLAWQRLDAEHRAEGPDGVEAVLELLDGYALAAAAWEPEVLAARVKEYVPQWLDRLCFTGRLGWGRLSPPQNQNGRVFGPLRSSPIALFTRENLSHWLALSAQPASAEFTPDTQLVLATLSESGAMFFAELVRRTKLLPSRVEQALAELAALGWVTADSFEGLRALLIPQEKRTPFADPGRKRHHKAVTSVEFAGRWTLLRNTTERVAVPSESAASRSESHDASTGHDQALEAFTHALLRRYGVVFRRLLEREALKASWFELGRVYRRLEARGEIRGGHFVNGVGGEQFALPEAIGLLRSLRKAKVTGEMVVLNATDPLNLLGILAPGPRIPAVAGNRILLRDGVAVAALVAGEVVRFEDSPDSAEHSIKQALSVGSLPAALRPYYS